MKLRYLLLMKRVKAHEPEISPYNDQWADAET
jgi:hypothetical protein